MRKSLSSYRWFCWLLASGAQSTRRTASVHSRQQLSLRFQKIDAERIRAHVRYLSHDLLEGRGTGQRGATSQPNILPHSFRFTG